MTNEQKAPTVVGAVEPSARAIVARLRRYGKELAICNEAADEIVQLRQVWEGTRTQRDELLTHIAGKAPMPQWAADWLKP